MKCPAPASWKTIWFLFLRHTYVTQHSLNITTNFNQLSISFQSKRQSVFAGTCKQAPAFNNSPPTVPTAVSNQNLINMYLVFHRFLKRLLRKRVFIWHQCCLCFCLCAAHWAAVMVSTLVQKVNSVKRTNLTISSISHSVMSGVIWLVVTTEMHLELFQTHPNKY